MAVKKYTERDMITALKLVEDGNTPYEAAKICGLNHQTVKNHAVKDPDLRARILAHAKEAGAIAAELDIYKDHITSKIETGDPVKVSKVCFDTPAASLPAAASLLNSPRRAFRKYPKVQPAITA